MIVCLEGIDACGKGTHAALLTARMNAKLWKFPNKETPTGKLIYAHLAGFWAVEENESGIWKQGWHSAEEKQRYELASTLAWPPSSGHTDALVFQALQLANRMEVASELFQAAAKGNVVFDRYWPSGYAYGKTDGLDPEYLVNLHRWLPQPDLFVLLDIDPRDSVKRRPERRDRYENKAGLMHQVALNYLELWSQHAGEARWVVVNARGSKEETAGQINEAVARHREAVST